VSLRRSNFSVPSSGITLVITIVVLLSSPSSSTCEDEILLPNTTQTNFPINNVVDVEGEGKTVEHDSTITIASTRSMPILFDNCDIATYYEGHSKDRGDWGWNRGEIASLLLRTHRQVIPSEAAIEFLSGGGADLVASALRSRTYATNTNTRKALIELDKGRDNYSSSTTTTSNMTENSNSDIETVRMIFTQRDIPAENGLIFGWEPGYLWPVNEFVHSSSSSSSHEVEKDYQKYYHDELSAAVHDLHNIRPRVPIVHKDHQAKKWYYDSCGDCDLQAKNGMAQQRTDGRASNNSPKWDGININGNHFILDDDDDEGSDHLCVCTKKHALQPPEEARGEVARALLYMNLRYGTRTAAHTKRAIRRNLDVDFLDLALTDCPPVEVVGDDNDDDSQQKANNIGYFSRLVQWHRENPPSQQEIDRNQKICEQYQGNRNPFVDFYEESWTLLDFDRIEREVCNGKGYSNHEGESNYDTYYDDDFVATQQHTISDEHLTKDSQEDTKDGYACGDLLPGDISFFMVQPGTIDSDKSNDLNQDEELQRESFGLVALVDLEPALTLYVVGVDDDDIDIDIDIINATATEGQFGSNGGILKVEVPEKGIPNGSYFGFGKGLYLGDQWEPVLEEGDSHQFSVQQLYLYCIVRDDGDEIGDTSMMDEYKILAAMSTTGSSFGENELPSYWENFQIQHSSIILSETFTNGIYYGLIVLPEDASDSELSGGYRYMGPTYTKHDKYAKALIDEANWKRMNSLGGENGVYGEVAEEAAEQSTKRGIVDPSKWPLDDNNGMQQKLDETGIIMNENSSSGYCQRSTLQTPGLSSFLSVVTFIIIPSILILVNC